MGELRTALAASAHRPLIYALCHPVTQEVRYIGKTVDPVKRYSHHKRNTSHRHLPLYVWWDQLAEQGLQPLMCVVATATTHDWESLERTLIAQFKVDGADLLNMTAGGVPSYYQPQSESVKAEKDAERALLRDRKRRAKAGLVQCARARRLLVNQGNTQAIARLDARLAAAIAKAPHIFGMKTTA